MVESGRRRRTKEEEAVMVVLLGLCILSCLLTPVRGATDQSDASALWNMYSSLNNAAQLTKWIANGGDPCGESWKGITCSNSRVTQIDVSNNNLAGQIPYSLPPSVQRLNLANNNFNGDIPYSISQMTSLKYLDLSFNSLTGNLPRSFSSLSSMTTMYLQNNQFSGDINVLANLPLDTLRDGNSFSSGPAPPPPPGTPPITKSNRNHRSGSNNSPSDSDNGGGGKKSGIGGGGIAGIIISLLVVGGIIAFFLVKRRSKRSSPDIEKFDNQPLAPLASNDMHEMKSVQTAPAINTKTFDTSASITLKPPPIDRHKSFDEEDFPKKPVVVKKPVKIPVNVTSYSVADLQMATGSFGIENLLGEGTFGRVYRAHFDDGKVVAVKKLDSSAIPSEFSDEFPEMVSNISELHHTNVTELVGYCAEHGQHILIYEFHKNGSLYDFFHLSDEYSKPLTWNTRVKIALGTARALEYLHEVCSPSIVHKNIKSANILLDSELNPHLSDSGLASFLPNAEQ
ncbi:hypothetical protein CRG98_035211, partial [Punica granatum]